MKNVYAVFILILAPLLIDAQTLKIIDKQTESGVPDVYIYDQNRDLSVSSDENGSFSLEEFTKGDTLHFQHPSYNQRKLAYNKIKNKNSIELKINNYGLNEVVISANKWEQESKEVPKKIARIPKKSTDFNNPQTAADLLESSGEVYVQKSQLGGGSPMIRGFATKSVLLVVDGVRMNNTIFRGGNLQNVISLDPHLIQETEVIFGPGSVIYGSDALGGVMDFHTISPELAVKDSINLSIDAMGRYSSANDENTGHIHANYSWKNIGFLTSLSYSDFDHMEMGSRKRSSYKRNSFIKRINGVDKVVPNSNKNLQKPSGYDQYNFTQKIRITPGDHFDINLGLHYSETSNIPRYDRLIQRKQSGKLKNAEWYYGPQKWGMINLNTRYTDTTALFDEAKLTTAYQEFQESRHDREVGEVQLRNRTENVDIFSVNLDMNKEITPKSSFYYGFQSVLNKVNSRANLRNIETDAVKSIATRYPDGSTHDMHAAYLKFRSNLNEKITLNAGTRYTYIDIKADLSGNSEFFDLPVRKMSLQKGALNGSLGLVYRPNTSWQLNLSSSTGFRAPNIDDIAKVFDSEPGRVVVPNDDLNPEYTYNLELGIRKSINNTAKFTVTPFYTYVDNAMVRRPKPFNGKDSIIYDGALSKTLSIVNKGSAQIYGTSAKFRFNIIESFLSFQAKATLMDGRSSDGEPIRHVAPFFTSSALTYDHQKLRVKGYVVYNGKRSASEMPPSERNKPHMYVKNQNGELYSPSWYTLNLKASYRITENIKINGGIENILDHRYRPYSSGIAGPGRNFIAAVRFNL
ncbi:MAG: TonB-dependent receptor [Flavobacteriales bacterium]